MNNPCYTVNIEAAIFKENKWLLAKRSAIEKHAAGTLSLVGGKVEEKVAKNDVKDETLKREIMEEVGITIYDDIQYVKSSTFTTEDGERIIDIVFLCRHKDGEPIPKDPDELSAVCWMTYEEIISHADVHSWTRESMEIAEKIRSQLVQCESG